MDPSRPIAGPLDDDEYAENRKEKMRMYEFIRREFHFAQSSI